MGAAGTPPPAGPARPEASLSAAVIAPLQAALAQHPVYAAVAGIDDLRVFMSHHVHSVWDFMSLVKSLQGLIAPTTVPWTPQGDPQLRRFINELVLEEESDLAPGEPVAGERRYASHFELYLEAMREVGADPGPIRRFVDVAGNDGIAAALASAHVPASARRFSEATFGFIDSGRPHVVAAALALGREHVIPPMFRALLARIGVGEREAPVFHYYLKRHVHLDEDFHAPLSLRLLNRLCDGDPRRIGEATAAAQAAVDARLRFWDGVLAAIEQARSLRDSAGSG